MNSFQRVTTIAIRSDDASSDPVISRGMITLRFDETSAWGWTTHLCSRDLNVKDKD